MNNCTSLNEQIDTFIIDELKLNIFGSVTEATMARTLKETVVRWEQFKHKGKASVRTDEREVWRSDDGLRRLIISGSGASRFDGLYVEQHFIEGEWVDAA